MTPGGDATPSVAHDETATLHDDVGNVRQSLHAAVDARKQTERDAQLLMNRIQLLKNEEMKALRSIAITRTKAAQLQSVKRDVAVRESERVRLERAREEQASVSQERNTYMRHVSRQARESSKKQIEHSKLKAAFETKQGLQRRIQEKMTEEESSRLETMRRTEAIKQERVDARRRMEQERIDRLKSFQREYENRLQDEERQRLETEALVAKLERDELELIKRLQKAQEMQSQVFDELGVSVPQTPVPGSTTKGSLNGSARKTPSSDQIKSPHIAAPTLSSLSRRDLGGPAMR